MRFICSIVGHTFIFIRTRADERLVGICRRCGFKADFGESELVK